MILNKDSIGVMELDATVPCLLYTPYGEFTSAEIRNQIHIYYDIFVEQMKTYPNLKWIVDSRHHGAMDPEDSRWISNEGLAHKLVALGVRSMAMVVPEDVFGQLSVENYSESLKEQGQVDIRFFENVELGKEWLKTVER